MDTILVADDDREVRELIALALTEDGYQVLEAENGDDAWRLLLEHQPRLALLDQAMPGRTGLELAEAMTSEPTLSDTRIVILTGIDPMRLEHEHNPAEAPPRIDLYILKPFALHELRELVAKELRG